METFIFVCGVMVVAFLAAALANTIWYRLKTA